MKKPEVTETPDSEQNLIESMGLSRPRPKDRYRTEDISPKLELLWTFKCKLLIGYIPLCIEYNKENTVRGLVMILRSVIICMYVCV